MKIPLTKPYWGKLEEEAAISALRHSSGTGDGPYSQKLATQLKKLTGSRFVFPVTSCTHGLELAMVALGIGPGDEVIVPSFTMTSTANCVVLRGATPVFADIEDIYYGLDPADVRQKLTKRTRGVIFVAYAGMAGKVEEIREICKKNNLFLVEDAAHAIGATYKGKHLGTFGDIGVYSFHGTKNVSCGEGGAVLTDNKRLAEKMEIYRANGTNRAAFLAGIVDKYSWIGKGTSYLLSDILASILISQISQINQISKKRQQIANSYTKAFQPYRSLIRLPQVPKICSPNWHIYAIRFHKVEHRNVFLKEMRKAGIDVAYHYVPLHTSKMGKKLASGALVDAEEGAYRGASFAAHPSSEEDPRVTRRKGPVDAQPSSLGRSLMDEESGMRATTGGRGGAGPALEEKRVTVLEKTRHAAPLFYDLPVTDRVAATLIRLPIYPGLTKRELNYIVFSAQKILKLLKSLK